MATNLTTSTRVSALGYGLTNKAFYLWDGSLIWLDDDGSNAHLYQVTSPGSSPSNSSVQTFAIASSSSLVADLYAIDNGNSSNDVWVVVGSNSGVAGCKIQHATYSSSGVWTWDTLTSISFPSSGQECIPSVIWNGTYLIVLARELSSTNNGVWLQYTTTKAGTGGWLGSAVQLSSTSGSGSSHYEGMLHHDATLGATIAIYALGGSSNTNNSIVCRVLDDTAASPAVANWGSEVTAVAAGINVGAANLTSYFDHTLQQLFIAWCDSASGTTKSPGLITSSSITVSGTSSTIAFNSSFTLDTASTLVTTPALTMDGSGNLYAFWATSASGTSSDIKYVKITSPYGSGQLGTVTNLTNAAASNNVFPQTLKRQRSTQGYITLLYLTQTSSPWKIWLDTSISTVTTSTRTVPTTGQLKATSVGRSVPATGQLKALSVSRSVPATGKLKVAGLTRTVPAHGQLKATSVGRSVPATGQTKALGVARSVPTTGRTKATGVARTVPVTGQLSVPGGTARTVPVTGQIKATSVPRSVPSTGRLKALSVARSVLVVGRLEHTSSRSVPAIGALKATLGRAVPATGQLKGVQLPRSVPSTGRTKATGLSRSVPATGKLTTRLTRSVPTTGLLRLAGTGIGGLTVGSHSQSWSGGPAGSPGTATDVVYTDAQGYGAEVALIPSYGGANVASWYEIDNNNGPTGSNTATNEHALTTSTPDGWVHEFTNKGGTFLGSEDFTYTSQEQAPTGTDFRRYYLAQKTVNDGNGFQWNVYTCIYPGDPMLIMETIQCINTSGSSIALAGSDGMEVALIAGLEQANSTWAPANGGYGTVGGSNTSGWPSALTNGQPDYFYILPAAASGINLGTGAVKLEDLTALSPAWSSLQFQYLQNTSRLKVKIQATVSTFPASTTHTIHILRVLKRNLTSSDMAAIAADILAPGTPSTSVGSFTAFRTQERAYEFAASANHLTATLDLSPVHVTTRYKPIVKVTGWTATILPTVTWGGSPLVNGVDFRYTIDQTNQILYLQLYFDVVASGAVVPFTRNNAALAVSSIATLTRSVPVTGALKALSVARTVPVTGRLKASSLARTVPSTGRVLAHLGRAVPTSGQVKATSMPRTVPAHGAVKALSLARAVPTSGRLQALSLARHVPATGRLSFAGARSVPTTGRLLAHGQRTIPASGRLLGHLSRAVPTAGHTAAQSLARSVPSHGLLGTATQRTVPVHGRLRALQVGRSVPVVGRLLVPNNQRSVPVRGQLALFIAVTPTATTVMNAAPAATTVMNSYPTATTVMH